MEKKKTLSSEEISALANRITDEFESDDSTAGNKFPPQFMEVG
ncbi:MAG: hypothetical protein PHQ36_01850 [Anaerolineales bacterium]|nr:hypothetical protein [Anaerolineales bacterium]